MTSQMGGEVPAYPQVLIGQTYSLTKGNLPRKGQSIGAKCLVIYFTAHNASQ